MAMVLVSAALGGCAQETATLEGASDDLASSQSGLWVLEGSAKSGDIELIQLGRHDHTSLVREATPTSAMSANAAGAGSVGPTAAAPVGAVTGNVTDASRGTPPKLSFANDDGHAHTLVVSEVSPDELKVTTEDGRVLVYKRSYQLYCVSADPGTEATMLLEMGAAPKLVGVNGDGRSFPTQGNFDAVVDTTLLHETQTSFVVTANVPPSNLRPIASEVRVQLSWLDMTKPVMQGEVAMTGPANVTPPTRITCERIVRR